MKRKLLISFLAVTLAFPPTWAPTWADELPELGDVSGADLSPWQERKLGRRIMNEIRWNDPAYLNDAEVEAYLNQLGNRLVQASTDPGTRFSFFAINDRMINAFATFGGYVGVNTGLILNAQSESELAGVLAHEVSHVTQHHLARQISQGKSSSLAMLGVLAAALLVGMRGNGQAGMGSMVGVQAGIIQNQLGYSREFEREADRLGLQALNKAGFDPTGMSVFFGRLQHATRVYENNAPAYLRTHPLTTERIADMQNREALLPTRPALDSLAFRLVRTKLAAAQGTAAEAVKAFLKRLAEEPAENRSLNQYGLALAHAKAQSWSEAEKALREARRLGLQHSMLDRLGIEILLGKGEFSMALKSAQAALRNEPDNLALVYVYLDALQKAGQGAEAFAESERNLKRWPDNGFLWKEQAKIAAALGKQAAQHRAQGEFYALQDKVLAALEQFQLAQKAGDGNFYEMSVLDARLHEMQRLRQEEVAESRNR